MHNQYNLTPRHFLFVQEYMKDLNAAQSAIRAGYAEKSAKIQGAKLLAKPKVVKAIKDLQGKRAQRLNRTADDVLKDIQEVTREAREAGDHRAAFKGLELEGKHLGMFTEKLEISGSLDIISLEKARQRVKQG